MGKLLFLFLALLVGLIGGLAGSLLTDGPRAGESMAPAPLARVALTTPHEAELAQAIEGLSRRIEELGRELRTARAPADGGGPAREPVHATELPGASLEMTLRRLATALEGNRPTGLTGAAQLPPAKDFDATQRPVDDEQERSLNRELLLSGYQAVLERFGHPDHIYVRDNGSLAWTYGSEKGAGLRVWFLDGQLFGISRW